MNQEQTITPEKIRQELTPEQQTKDTIEAYNKRTQRLKEIPREINELKHNIETEKKLSILQLQMFDLETARLAARQKDFKAKTNNLTVNNDNSIYAWENTHEWEDAQREFLTNETKICLNQIEQLAINKESFQRKIIQQRNQAESTLAEIERQQKRCIKDHKDCLATLKKLKYAAINELKNTCTCPSCR